MNRNRPGGEGQRHRDPAWGKRGYRMSLSHRVLLSRSELVAEIDIGIVDGRIASACSAKGSTGVGNGGTDEAVGEAALDLRVHYAGVQIDVLGEAPINHDRDCIQSAGATRGDRSSGAVGIWVRVVAVVKTVLPLVVIRTGDVESRRDRVANTEPGGLKDLVGDKGVVVGDSKDNAALPESARVQRIVRVGKVDVLIAAEQLPWSDRVPGSDLEHSIVGDRGRDLTGTDSNRRYRPNPRS